MATEGLHTAIEYMQDATMRHGKCAHAELTEIRLAIRRKPAKTAEAMLERAIDLHEVDTILQSLARLIDAWS